MATHSPANTTTLALGLIRRDGGTQPRDQIDAKIAEEYAEAIADGAELPAVTVFYDGSTYWLADGFHRAVAHDRLDRSHIAVDVRQGTQRDAVLYSVGANASHGHRRSNADKRRAVQTMLNDPEWSGWSDREIARRCSVTHPFVSGLRPSGNDCQMDRTVERNGKSYTMNTSAIGKKADDTAEDDMESTEAATAQQTGRRKKQSFVPEGADILTLCRKGIALEEGGRTADSVAAELGLSRDAYRISRQMVFLSDRIPLTDSDAAIVAKAIALLATTAQVSQAWEIAQPVAVKVWGRDQRWDRPFTLADRRIEKFERTFGIVIQACLTTEEIELPYLSAEKVSQSIKEIAHARQALAAFSARIKETHK